MNPYLKNLNRIEFLITLACTGRCKHCSEGEHTSSGEYINGDIAVRAVNKVCANFNIKSLMTFGGEALLHVNEVCKIHAAAQENGIPKRQLITNGFFHKSEGKIKSAVTMLAQSGVNAILLSVDAFHQETIPLEPVRYFAQEIKSAGISLRTNPAWLVGPEDKNPYNLRTVEILKEFEAMGITSASGNIIFPSGNALKFLKEYFDAGSVAANPYDEDPKDVRSLCISPNGDVLGGNIYRTDILNIIENYAPEKMG